MHRIALRAFALTPILIACCVVSSFGAVHVLLPDGSGDFPTIQQALAAADSGDQILLADGIYLGDENRNLDFLGKPLTLRSQSGNPAMCIIDCSDSGGRPELVRRAFEFHNYEDSTSVVRDLTIANGSAGGT